MWSNRAATRVILLKGGEKRQHKNLAISRCFASSRNPWHNITLHSHGRGRWFEPSIAHSEKILYCREKHGMRDLGRRLSRPFVRSSTPTRTNGANNHQIFAQRIRRLHVVLNDDKRE
jgi:hypothetical protein